MTDDDALSVDERIDAIVGFEALAAIVDQLPVHDSRDGGRPRKNPVFALVLVHVIAKHLYSGRVRFTFTQLRDPRYWTRLRDAVRAAHPDRPDFWLPETPMRRSQFIYFRDRYIAEPDGHEAYGHELEASALALMTELDLCQPHSPGSLTQPNRARAIEADGVVIRTASEQPDGAPIADPETGEIVGRHRGDADSGWHQEGGKKSQTPGHKLEVLSARGPGWHRRVILAVDRVPPGGEMEALKPMLDRLLPMLPGVLSVLNDGSMRGETIEYLMREHGVIGIAPTVARKRTGSGRQDRIEKEAFLETVWARRPDGELAQVDLWVRGGQVSTFTHDETGKRVWEPVTLTKLNRRGRRGAFRLYADLVTHDGLRIRLLSLLPTDLDRQRRFNRCENFRVFVPGSEPYCEVYPQRSDTESGNRQLKDSLWQRRSNVYRFRRVLADTLAWAIGHNAISAYIHRRQASAMEPAA